MTQISNISEVSFGLGKPPKYKSGDRYGDVMLTGKSYTKPTKWGIERYIECICGCNNIFWTNLRKLRSGHTKSCGCYNKTIITKHGMASAGKNHPIYKAWFQMKSRCYNPKDDSYSDYGGRGIYVCKEWLDSFESFRIWSIQNGWQNGLSLDRIENETGIYEPTNCRWANIFTQNRNKRNNNFLEAFGEVKCISEWVEDPRCSVTWAAIKYRISKMKWMAEDAISLPNGSHNNPNDNINN